MLHGLCAGQMETLMSFLELAKQRGHDVDSLQDALLKTMLKHQNERLGEGTCKVEEVLSSEEEVKEEKEEEEEEANWQEEEEANEEEEQEANEEEEEQEANEKEEEEAKKRGSSQTGEQSQACQPHVQPRIGQVLSKLCGIGMDLHVSILVYSMMGFTCALQVMFPTMHGSSIFHACMHHAGKEGEQA